MQRARRALLRLLTCSLSGLAIGGLAGCTLVAPPPPDASLADEDADRPAAPADVPGGTTGPGLGRAAAPGSSGTSGPAVATTSGPILTVAVPPTPTLVLSPPSLPSSGQAGQAAVPTATPRPRPLRAMVTVPYYSQHVGRLNYCLPTSIAMVADRYGLLPANVSGTRDLAPRYVVDVGYRQAKRRIADLDEEQFTTLWEEIGTDPLGGLIWDVFAPNGRDLVAGMSPALGYLVLKYAFELTPILGTLDECLVALADDVPSILFGSYGPLRRADGVAPNVGGYVGDHAFVLVGVDYERVIVNDPLPSDKTRYSGERGRSTASSRAVRFELASVRRMTRGDGGLPRGDCFMVPPPYEGDGRQETGVRIQESGDTRMSS